MLAVNNATNAREIFDSLDVSTTIRLRPMQLPLARARSSRARYTPRRHVVLLESCPCPFARLIEVGRHSPSCGFATAATPGHCGIPRKDA